MRKQDWKRAEKAQGKHIGQGRLKGKWDTGACKQCKKRPSEHTESLGGKQIVGPKRPNRMESNNIIARIAEWYNKKCQQGHRVNIE